MLDIKKNLFLIFKDIFKTKIIKGNYILFYLSRFITYFIFYFPKINFFNKLINFFPNKYVIIKNWIGKFYVNISNDSIMKSSILFENDVRNIFLNKNGDFFLDIGANIGTYSILMKKNFKRFYCFEPNINTFNILKENIKLNLMNKKSKIFNIGLGVKKSSFYITNNKFHSGGNHLIDKKIKNSIKINIDSIDNLLKKKELDLSGKGFIKIDVEGFEFEVIKGMKNTFKNLEIGSYFFVEINENKNEIFKILKNNSFEFIEKKFRNFLFIKK